MCIAKERIIKVKKFLRIWMKNDRNIHTFMELWVIFDPVSTGKVKEKMKTVLGAKMAINLCRGCSPDVRKIV